MLSWRLRYDCCGLRLLRDSVSADVEREDNGRAVRTAADQMLGSLTEAKCDSAQGDNTLHDALTPIHALIAAKDFERIRNVLVALQL